jgi:ubiquinone/menaquinone biosynthesis C-methylase UbiE
VSPPGAPTTADVRDYWNQHIHDLEITRHPVGSPGFFADLDQYHFEKLHHLLRLVDFNGYRGKRVLEVGCGAGTDLVRFARGGAIVTGVDLSSSGIALARKNFEQQGLSADLREADGERLPFEDDSFDLVYAHGVIQYTPDTERIVEECRRVLKPGGQAVFQAYNRVSWLNALSKLMKVPLEHEGAPVLKKFSAAEFRDLLGGFRDIRIVEERFPVKSRLHGGWKGTLFNTFFVGTFNALPRGLVRRFGWHLLAFCRK